MVPCNISWAIVARNRRFLQRRTRNIPTEHFDKLWLTLFYAKSWDCMWQIHRRTFERLMYSGFKLHCKNTACTWPALLPLRLLETTTSHLWPLHKLIECKYDNNKNDNANNKNSRCNFLLSCSLPLSLSFSYRVTFSLTLPCTLCKSTQKEKEEKKRSWKEKKNLYQIPHSEAFQ